MKKLFLLSALAMSAMTMSAQITKIATVKGRIEASSYENIGNVAYSEDSTGYKVTIYNDDFSDTKVIALSKKYKKEELHIDEVARNLFTADDKACLFLWQMNEDNISDYKKIPTTFKIVDEDGNIVKDFGEMLAPEHSSRVIKLRESYILVIPFWQDGIYTDIYSLPGNGQPTDLESPTAPARTSNARKVVENGQMYIILDGVKYAVTGTEM